MLPSPSFRGGENLLFTANDPSPQNTRTKYFGAFKNAHAVNTSSSVTLIPLKYANKPPELSKTGQAANGTRESSPCAEINCQFGRATSFAHVCRSPAQNALFHPLTSLLGCTVPCCHLNGFISLFEPSHHRTRCQRKCAHQKETGETKRTNFERQV